MLRFIASVLAVGMLAACASNKPNIDYDPTANFAAYKTFAWSVTTDTQTGKSKNDNPLIHQRVREAIENGLVSKGFSKADASEADLLVTYHLSVVARGPATRGYVSVGIGSFGSHSSVGISVGAPVGAQRVVKEGTLVIEIMDAKTNSLIWQGSSSREVSQQQDPQKSEQLIKQAVDEILANYPPT